jgi:outer membrane protein
MKKNLLIVVLLSVNLFALTIQEAVQTALTNNFTLQEQKYKMDESKAGLQSSYSALRPKVDLIYTYNNRDRLITGQIKEDTALSAVVSYNLFNGMSDRYNIKSSENLFQASKYTFEAAKQDIIFNTKQSYINYLLKKKQTRTMEEAYKLYQKQYQDSKNFSEQGLIAHNELLEVEVSMLNAKQNLQNAKVEQTIAKNELANILAVPFESIKEVAELKDFKETGFVYNETNIENRSELQALSFIAENYQNKLKSVEGAYVPRVDASYSYNKFGDDLDLRGRTGYPDSQNLGTITISWNLYNGGADENNKVIYIQKLKQTQMQLEDLKLQILLQYKKAIEEYQVAKLNFDTASKALELSKRNYEIVSDKVQEGLSQNKDLLDANYLVTNAKQNYFGAYYNTYLSVAKIERILEKSDQ